MYTEQILAIIIVAVAVGFLLGIGIESLQIGMLGKVICSEKYHADFDYLADNVLSNGQRPRKL